jgi:hypothetical protein
MPVVIAQPEPFAPALLAAYGLAEQQQQNQPRLADAYARLAQARAAGSGGNSQGAALAAQLMAQGNDRNYDRVQQSLNIDTQRQLQERDQELRQQQIAQAGMYTNAAAYNDDANLQSRAALMQLDQEMSQQALTFKEEQKLKVMQTRMREVRQDNSLTDPEKAELITMLRTGVAPLEQRQQAAQARMQEQHAQLYEQQVAQQKRVKLKAAEFDAKTLPQRTVTIPMPEGGFATLVQTGVDQNGDPTYTQLKDEKQTQVKEWTHADEADLTKSALEIAKARTHGTNSDGTPKTKDQIENEAKQSLPDVMAEMRAKEPRLRGQPNQGAAAFQGQPAPEPPKPQPPFEVGKPQTEEQKHWVAVNTQIRDTAAKLTGERKQRADALIGMLESMLARHGSPAAVLASPDRPNYEGAIRELAGVLPQNLPESASGGAARTSNSAAEYRGRQPVSNPRIPTSGFRPGTVPMGR